MQKVPKKPKPPKKKIKPPAKKKPKPKAKHRPKAKSSEAAKPPKAKTSKKKAEKPEKERPDRPERPEGSDRPSVSQQPAEQRNFVTVDKGKDPQTAATCHSFAPDTRVLMADGSTRPISEVNVGDKVATTNPETGENSDQQVTLLHANRDQELTDVTVSTAPAAATRTEGEGKGGRSTRGPTESTLETTAHHPFWDATAGDWVDAAELTPGTSTLVGPDGQIQYVTAVDNFTGTEVMRDLTVATTHTYYVIAGTEPVLAHNNDNVPCITGPTTSNTHYAQVTVRDADGALLDRYALRSGGTTPEEAALGKGLACQVVHTEHRAGRISGGAPMAGKHVIKNDPFWGTSPVPEGGLVSIAGIKSPCGTCQKQMKESADDTGATFEYHWPDGQGGVKTWSTDDF